MNNSAVASMEGYALFLAGCSIFLKNDCCHALLEPVLQNSTRQRYSVDFFPAFFSVLMQHFFFIRDRYCYLCKIRYCFPLFRCFISQLSFYIEPYYMLPLLDASL